MNGDSTTSNLKPENQIAGTEVCDIITGKYQPNQKYGLPHLFIIPVEWQETSEPDGTVVYLDRKVTKLRCECGKEQERK